MKSKFFKIILYTLVGTALLLLSFGLQLSIVTNRTFLSSDYFYSAFENSNAKSDLTKFILEKISGESVKLDTQTKKEIEDIVGASTKGIYSFIIGDHKKLPVIDLTGHRDQIKGYFKSSVEGKINREKELDKIKQAIFYVENNPEADLDSFFLSTDSGKKLKISKDAVSRIKAEILKNKSSNVKNDPDKILNLVIEEIANETVLKEHIGLKIDLNKKEFRLTDKIDEKPKSQGVFNNIMKFSNIILLALLIILVFIGLQFFEKRRFLRIYSILLFVLALLETTAAIILRLVVGVAYDFSDDHIKASVIEFIHKMIQGFLGQYIVLSLVFILLAVILFIVSFFIKKGAGTGLTMKKVKNLKFVSIFIAAGLAAGCFIVFKQVFGIIHTINYIRSTISVFKFDDIFNIFI